MEKYARFEKRIEELKKKYGAKDEIELVETIAHKIESKVRVLTIYLSHFDCEKYTMDAEASLFAYSAITCEEIIFEIEDVYGYLLYKDKETFSQFSHRINYIAFIFNDVLKIAEKILDKDLLRKELQQKRNERNAHAN